MQQIGIPLTPSRHAELVGRGRRCGDYADAQAAGLADISTPFDRGRRCVLLGSASFLGFLAVRARGMKPWQMPGMGNCPALPCRLPLEVFRSCCLLH